MSSSAACDVIVIGAGGMGSAAAWRLAGRGARVRAFERFGVGHDRGSSHGETRLIRQAYFEHPDYVPLLKRAYELWAEAEAESGASLFERCGLVIYGPERGGEVLPGVLEAAERHGIPVEVLSRAESLRRFPEYRVPEGHRGVFEPGAGYLRVEECVRQFARLARSRGAVIQEHEPVRRWRAEPGFVEVETERGTYRADRLVITAGAWSTELLGDAGIRVQAHRNYLFWFPQPRAASAKVPAFAYDLPEGFFYGFPRSPDGELKVALHRPGASVSDPERELKQPPPESEVAPVREFAGRWLEGIQGQAPARWAACLYEMSPDTHFVLGLHPRHGNVALGAGFSGHGFKFAAVVGEILADLALDGRTRHPVGFLSASRLGSGLRA